MNASLIVSVTATVLCVAITVAVYFAMSGDANAASYHYRVSFETNYWTEVNGASVSSGSGTIVVNKGVQSFCYTDSSGTKCQEEDGLTYTNSDGTLTGGADFVCVGDVGGLNYASSTPQAVAGSLSEIDDVADEANGGSLICDAGDKVWAINAFDTPYFICSDSDGTPKSVSGTNFKASVTSFEMDENTPFEAVTVNSDNVDMSWCADTTEAVMICAVDTADSLGPTFQTSATCCDALGGYVRNQVDGAAVSGCDKFQACYGSCHMFTANFIDMLEEEAEITDARSGFDAWCAEDTVEDLAASCESSRRLEAKPHWRDIKKIVSNKSKLRAANHKKAGMSTEQLDDRRALREMNTERTEKLNRARFQEKHGDDYERHLTQMHGEEGFQRSLTAVNACFMHGMGCEDNCGGGDYWGDLVSFLPAGSAVHIINTDSKYCDYKASGSFCTGAVPDNFLDSNGDVDLSIAKANRGSLPAQYQAYIDHWECNFIVGHSMANPTMHEVWHGSGKLEKYQWFNSNGPVRGSTAAHVVTEYCEQGFWDYFSFQGVQNAAMLGIASAMGYCSGHHALLSMRPHNNNEWKTAKGNCLPFIGGGPNCPDSRYDCGETDTKGCGAHYKRYSEEEHWFEMEHVNGHENKCTGWAWFGCAGRTLVAIVTFEWVCQQDATCEDSGDFKGTGGGFTNHAGMLGAMCGDGEGYGLGSGVAGWFGLGQGGDLQNIGLWLIHKIADYGEGSDGMVAWSACKVPGRTFGDGYESPYYRSDQTHLDGTCFSGDGDDNFRKPCSWIGAMAATSQCDASAHQYERNGYCNSWSGSGYCNWHGWVQAQCPCTC